MLVIVGLSSMATKNIMSIFFSWAKFMSTNMQEEGRAVGLDLLQPAWRLLSWTSYACQVIPLGWLIRRGSRGGWPGHTHPLVCKSKKIFEIYCGMWKSSLKLTVNFNLLRPTFRRTSFRNTKKV
jgi:hypothetical protein